MSQPQRVIPVRETTRLLQYCASIGVALLISATAAAQSYPAKTIRVIAPFAPGGGADYLGRLTGQYLTEVIGQSVVVENRVGAAGIIGYEYGLKSPPDGYTLTVVSTSYGRRMNSTWVSVRTTKLLRRSRSRGWPTEPTLMIAFSSVNSNL